MSYFNKKVTTAQLAKICGVSQGTIDRALNNRSDISPATKEKIVNAAKKYGYMPDISCQSGSKTMLFGIVVFSLYNEYFSRLVMEIENVSKERGYSTLIMFSNRDKKTEIECINRLIFMGVDGIILCPVSDDSDYKSYLNTLKTPIITVGNKVDGIPYSGIDDYRAMVEVTNYVRSKNYKKIIYYSPPLEKIGDENIYAQNERYLGFLSAISDFPNHIVTTDIERLVASLTNDTAVICTTDYHAIQLTHRRNGNLCGIIGFDDINILSLLGIRLDSVSYSSNKIAENAAAYLSGASGHELPRVPHSLVIRGSL